MEDFNLKKYLAENKLLNEQGEKDEKDFVAINAIIADLNDKVPQFKTIDTPDEYLALLDRIIKILIKESPSFVGSGRFIAANVAFYNKRKDYSAAATAQGDNNEPIKEATAEENRKEFYDSLSDAEKRRFQRKPYEFGPFYDDKQGKN